MARLVICATLILSLVAIIAISGCAGRTTTTTAPVSTTTTLTTSSTSGQSSSTGSGPSTTMVMGQTWQEVISRFTTSVTEANLPGTLPYSMLPEDEVAWLLGTDAAIHPASVSGFRFANGDLVILFGGSMLVDWDPLQEPDSTKVLSDAQTALQGMAEARYQVSGKSVEATVFDLAFGFIVVAGKDAGQLGGLALSAHV